MVRLVELAFTKKSLRDVCESQIRAERVLGVNVARALRARLADLRAAASVDDLVAGPPQIVQSEPPGRVALPLGEGICLAFCGNHRAVPTADSGQVNWSKVNRIKIVHVGGVSA